jgi:hypothetical protein
LSISIRWSAVAVAAASAGYAIWLLVSPASWIHPEVFAGSVYVWINPGQESFAAMLRKVFDWKAFDPNVNRVRPLNDLFEVIDAIVRPYLTMWLVPLASLSPSTLIAAIATPLCLFGYFRRRIGDIGLALVMVALILSTTGFLSLTVATLHPAKKINFVLLAAAFFFAERNRGSDIRWMMISVFASFFADELGLANFVIIGLIYWRRITEHRTTLLAYASLPLLFLIVTKWILPIAYYRFGWHGAWDALADQNKFGVFGYLIYPDFYQAAWSALGRSILASIGISLHTPATEAGVAGTVVISTVAAWLMFGRRVERLILVAAALIALSTYATLLDWYPFPHEVSYLGSFNYYYHSPVVILVGLWLAEWLRIVSAPIRSVAIAVGALAICANFVVFARVNDLVEMIHYYPHSRTSLFALLDRVGAMPAGQAETVTVTVDSSYERQRFEAAGAALFGTRANGFRDVFTMLVPTPIMSPSNVANMIHSYYPFHKIKVDIQSYSPTPDPPVTAMPGE